MCVAKFGKPALILIAVLTLLGAGPLAAGEPLTVGNDVVIPSAAASRSAKASVQVGFAGNEGDLAVYEVSGNYNRDLAGGAFNLEARAAVAESFYATHADNFDFLVVFSTFEFDTGEARAFYVSLYNDIDGIGQAPLNLRPLFQNSQKLQGYIDMAALSRYEMDTLQVGYDGTLDTLLHETMHRWGVEAQFKDGASNSNSDELLGYQRAHWSQFVSSDASIMGGGRWRDNGDGSFSATAVRYGYNPVDLYLGGFLPPEQVPGFFFLRQAQGDPNAYWPEVGDHTTGQRVDVGIDQIVSALGPRQPAYAQSQRDFRAAFLLLKQPGEEVPPRVVAELNDLMRAYATRFSVLTRGLGVMRTRLAEAASEHRGDPVVISGQPGQGGAADLSKGATWLLEQQQPGGYWEDKPLTRVLDTVHALQALEQLNVSDPGLDRARTWLGQHTALNQDEKAWMIGSGALSGRTIEEVQDLELTQASDGGWGLVPGLATSTFDTALILEQLQASGLADASVLDKATTYLMGQRLSGWGPVAGGAASVEVSARALGVLFKRGVSSADLGASLSWLTSVQNSDGSFGSGPGSSHETAMVLRSLSLRADGYTTVLDAAALALENRQANDGSWEGSVYTTAQALLALRGRQNPNLTLAPTLVASPAQPRDGDLVALEFRVTNSGLLETSPSLVRVYVGEPGNGGNTQGSDVMVPALAAGASVALITYWDSFNYAGAQSLYLVADPDDSLAESNENDNRASLTLTVNPPSDTIDLSLLGNSLSFEPGVIATLPTSLHVALQWRNPSTSPISGAVVSLQWSVDNGPWVELSRQQQDLGARTTAPLSFDSQLTQSGRVRLRLLADPDGQLAEADETNNLVAFEMGQQASLDLTVLASDLSLVQAEPTSGEDIIFQTLIRNLGTNPSPPVKIEAWIDGPTGSEQILDQTAQLQAGELAPRELSWRANQVGAFMLRVRVDGPNIAAEADETNNEASLGFEVVSSSLPNLAVSHEALVFQPLPGLEGQPLTVTLPLLNSSSVDAGPFSVSLYRGAPTAGGILQGSQDFPDGLAGNATTQISITTPVIEGAGEILFYIAVDEEDDVLEHNETDNSAFEVIEVLHLPDLSVTPGNVSLDPAFPVSGETINATITVDNLGAQPATQVGVLLFEVDENGQELQIGTATIDEILPHGSGQAEISWTFGQIGTTNQLRLVVDPANSIVETDESNNSALIPTVVQDRHFFASQRFISPNGDHIQDQTELAYTVDTPGELSIEIHDRYDRIVRGFSGGPLRGQARGVLTWDGRDDSGVIVRDGEYRVRLLDEDSSLLGQLLVTVDTNRTPIIEAAGTARAYLTDLRCSIQAGAAYSFSADGKYLYANGITTQTGENQTGLFRLPTRGHGLDTLVSQDWLNSVPRTAGVGDKITRFFVLEDGKIVFATSQYTCGNCDQALWLKKSATAAPVRLKVAPATQFTALSATPEYALIDGNSQPNNIIRVSLDPSEPGLPLLGPSGYSYYRKDVLGGYLAVRGENGTFNGSSTYVQEVWFVSASAGVAPVLLGYGPESEIEVSLDRSHVAVFGHTQFYDYDEGQPEKTNKAESQYGQITTWDLSTGTATALFSEGFELPAAWDYQISWSPDNRLLALDGPNARLLLRDRHGDIQKRFELPTALFQEYLGSIESISSRYLFPKVQDWQEFGAEEHAVRWDEKGQNFLLSFALYVKQYRQIPSKTGDGSADKATAERFNGVHLAQVYRFNLAETSHKLLGTINTTGDSDIIFPQQFPEWEQPYRMTWMASTDTILMTSSTTSALDMLPKTDLHTVPLGDVQKFWPPRPGSFSKKLLLYNPEVEEAQCGDGDPYYVYESADNLIAHLELGQEGLVLELKGVAADRSLASHQLDWAYASAPNTWFTLSSPSTVSVIDDELDTWVPPTPGTYLVRLRVRDKAGNQDEAIRTVNWFDQASLAGVKVEPRYISPNGDGIQDSSVISFRVLEPIHLNVTVEDKTGHVVRTISGDYPVVTGASETLIWNGRNQAGNLVSDGNYLVRVQNRRFKVVVDTKAPVLALEKLEAYSQNEFTENVEDKYRLYFSIAEANLFEGQIDFQDELGGRHEFHAIAAEAGTESYHDEVMMDQASFINDVYRISASDLAGNKASLEQEPIEPELILKTFRQLVTEDTLITPELKGVPYQDKPFESTELPALTLTRHSQRLVTEVILTAPLPAGSFFVEYSLPASGTWTSLAATVLPADAEENVANDVLTPYRQLLAIPFEQLPADHLYMRTRVHQGGDDIFSNQVDVIIEPNLHIGLVAEELFLAKQGLLDPTEDNQLLLDLASLVPHEDLAKTQIWVRESMTGNPLNPRLTVTSADDARYATATVFLPKAAVIQDEPSAFSGYLFEVATLPCNIYEISFQASFPQPNAKPILVNTADPQSGGPFKLERSCIELTSSIKPVAGLTCAAQMTQKVDLTVGLEVDRGEVPTNLEVYALIGAAEPVLIANEPAPKIGERTFRIDTSNLPEGFQTLRIEAVDTVGERTVVTQTLPVDHTPPEVLFDYPGEHEVLCAELLADGTIVLPLEGVVRGGLPTVYQVSIGNGHDAPALQPIEPMPELDAGSQSTYFGELAQYRDPDKEGRPGWLTSGEVTARIEARDWSGASVCVERRFFLDVSVDVGVAKNFGLISPNGDGAFDSADILVTAYEQLTTKVELYRAVSDERGNHAIVGSPLDTLVDNQIIAGEWHFPWLGSDASGNLMADGEYGLRFTFSDACGLEGTRDSFGEVDNTPPDLAIDYPLTGDPVGAITEVIGNFQDLHFSSAELAFAEADGNPLWSTLERFRRPVAVSRVLATWPIVGLNGNYVLRLKARDQAANEAELLIPLEINQPTTLIWALNATPRLFSPNEDGVLDATQLGIGLNGAAVLTAEIRNQADQVQRTLLSDEPAGIGTQFLAWDGRNDGGTVVADGVYKLHVLARDPDSAFSQTEELSVTVDTTAPQLVLRNPLTPVVKGLGLFIAEFQDLHPNNAQVAYRDAEGQAVTVIETEQTGRSSGGDLSDLAEASYTLTGFARDLAGNVTHLEQPFTIDNTAPQAKIDTPTELAVVGGIEPLVAITGVASDAHFASYLLETQTQNGPWQTLATSTEAPVTGLRQSWPVSAPDGAYTLRLTVTDQAGWVSQAQRAVVVDTTAPVAQITSPVDGATIPRGSVVLGSASDLHLTNYRLQLSPVSGAPLWSDLFVGEAGVTDGTLMQWTNTPPDGTYLLRLLVSDSVGLTSESQVRITLDTEPPQPPIDLHLTVQPNWDVDLTWTASPSSDVAKYRLLRDEVQIFETTGTTYVDLDVAQGEHIYQVVAVDRVGNVSRPSNSARAVIDRVPPDVALLDPTDQSSVRGLVAVVGTATSPDDFYEYRLYVRREGDPEPGELLRRSGVPAVAERLAVWDSSSEAQETYYLFRLEGEDTHGNRKVVERRAFVDNQPPAAPTGLTAILQGDNNALTQWNANSEADLAGYLLYLDGLLANAVGQTGDDLTPYLIIPTNFLDLDLSDGNHQYVVHAVDQAGNISEPSAPASLVVETGPPDLVLVEPLDQTRFEGPLYILGRSEDRDIAQVLFEYAEEGSGVWTEISIDFDRPYEAILDPVVLGLELGSYQIRASATDGSGLVDPTPAEVTVEYTDLESPDALIGLAIHVDGDQAFLSWSASDASDLAGYQVYRLGSNSEFDPIGNLVTEPEFVDNDLALGYYVYMVRALDNYDNESDDSNQASAQIFQPTFQRPFSPTLTTELNLVGNSVLSGSVSGTIDSDQGSQSFGPITTQPNGQFVLPTLPLGLGSNQISFTVTDDLGNRSIPATLALASGRRPNPPLNPAVSVNALDIELTWQAPELEPDAISELETVGYRVFRDGQPVAADERLTGISWTASSRASDAYMVEDNNPYTYWYPSDADLYSQQKPWFQANFAMTLVTEVDMAFYWGHTPTSFSLEGWSGSDWIELARYDNAYEYQYQVQLPTPYRTDRLRLVVQAYNINNWRPVLLSEMSLQHRPIQENPSFAESLSDGRFTYSVTAINGFGFESDPSIAEETAVGDVISPDAVVLTGEVSGVDAQLSWSESASADLAGYRLFRDGTLIYQEDPSGDHSFRDTDLSNGTYTYHVVTFDQVGNVSTDSNAVALTIDGEVPAAPVLSLSLNQGGDALLLSWVPNGPTPDSYTLERAELADGPFEEWNNSDGDTTSYLDEEVTIGQTYYYRVFAYDSRGNASPASNVVSGRPTDATPPEVPILLFPTRPGKTLVTSAETSDIGGMAEPGAWVDLRNNGVPVGSIETSEESQYDNLTLEGLSSDAHLSPDGRFFLVDEYPNLIVGLDGTSRALPFDGARSAWLQDSKTFIVWHWSFEGELRVYNTAGFLVDTLLTWENINWAAPAPDGRKIAVAGSRYLESEGQSRSGIWVIDTVSHEEQELLGLYPGNVYNDQIVWSPNSAYLAMIAYESQVKVFVADLASGTITGYSDNVGGNRMLWDPSSSHVLFKRWSNQNINELDVANGSVRELDIEADTLIGYSPDQRLLAYGSNWNQIAFYDLENQEVLADSGDYFPTERATWHANGRIYATNWRELNTLTPAGSFVLENMPLQVGDNRVTATARDAANNRSAQSESILIQVPGTGLPDLAILAGDLAVLPAAGFPGDRFRINLQVRNLGEAAAPASQLVLLLTSPDGTGRQLLATPQLQTLAPGGKANFSVDLNEGLDLGNYRVTALVDGQNAVREVSESNNLAESGFRIYANQNPALALQLDRVDFPPGQAVTGSLEVFNPGPTFHGRVLLTAEDAFGFPIGTVLDAPVQGLAFGQSLNLPINWDTTGLFAGGYTFKANLSDTTGRLIDSAEIAFSLGARSEFGLSLNLDRSSYAPREPISPSLTVAYLNGNTPVAGARIFWQVLNADDLVLGEQETPLASMLPGATTVQTVTWNLADQSAGDYRLSAALIYAGGRQDTDLLFSLTEPDPVLSLSGSILLTQRSVSIGTPFSVPYQVRNDSRTALDDIPLRLELRRSGSLDLLASESTSASFAAGEQLDLQGNFSSSAMRFESYLILLVADLSGHGGSASTLLATSSISGIDAVAPVLEALNPSAGAVVVASLSARVSARDQLSPIASVKLALDGGLEQNMGQSSLPGIYRRELSGLSEGPHQIVFSATDTWSNRAQTTVFPFIVDVTAPRIQVSGINDGGLYNHSVSPIITIEELHAASSLILLNGEPYVSGSLIDREGPYVLSISAIDLAGNHAEASYSFELDLTPPQVQVSFPAYDALILDSSTAVTGSTDSDISVYLVNGAFQAQVSSGSDGSFAFANVPLSLGANQLVVHAVDRAGNVGPNAEVPVTSEVPTAAVQGQLLLPSEPVVLGDNVSASYELHNTGNLDLQQRPVRVVVYDSSETQLEQQQRAFDLQAGASSNDGFAFATAAWLPGNYRLVLSAQLEDGSAWIDLDSDLIALVDRTPPDLVLLDPTANALRLPRFAISAQAHDDHSQPVSVFAVLDDQESPMALVDGASNSYAAETSDLGDGPHSLSLRALDGVGNEATTTAINVVVDGTPPLIQISGVSEGQVSNQPLLPVISIEELHPDSQVITLDGFAFSSGDEVASNGSHVLSVSATDQVGNTSSRSLSFTIDREAPTVRIISPEEGTTLSEPSTGVMGETEAGALVTMTLAGQSFQTQADTLGQFSFPAVVLAYGDNQLAFHAADRAGNVGPDVLLNLSVARQVPTVAWLSPSPDASVSDGFEVAVSVHSTTPISRVELHLDGVLFALLDADSAVPERFAALVSPITAGAHQLQVFAFSDPVSGSSSLRHVTVLGSELELAISSPLEGSTIETETVVVNGTTSSGALVSLVSGAYQAQTVADNGHFSFADVPVLPGPNLIELEASLGNAHAALSLHINGTCAVCSGDELIVDEDVLVDFSTSQPSYSGDAVLAPYFSSVKAGTDPSTWSAIFALQDQSLRLINGAKITVVGVAYGRGTASPGLILDGFCRLTVEAGASIELQGSNAVTGSLVLKGRGDITIAGRVQNRIEGTWGTTGPLQISSSCGNLEVSPSGKVILDGTQEGGRDLSLRTLSGDITIQGLVDAVYSYGRSPNLMVAAPAGSITVSGDQFLGIEANTNRPIASGVSLRCRSSQKPGTLSLIAGGDVTVQGAGYDPRLEQNSATLILDLPLRGELGTTPVTAQLSNDGPNRVSVELTASNGTIGSFFGNFADETLVPLASASGANLNGKFAFAVNAVNGLPNQPISPPGGWDFGVAFKASESASVRFSLDAPGLTWQQLMAPQTNHLAMGVMVNTSAGVHRLGLRSSWFEKARQFGTVAVRSKLHEGGTLKVLAEQGSIYATDYAFDNANKDNGHGLIQLDACGEIRFERRGGTGASLDGARALLNASGSNAGGTNLVRALNGTLRIGEGCELLALGSPVGLNRLLACDGLINDGRVAPADLEPGDDSGSCAVSQALEINSLPGLTAVVGQAYSYRAIANDPDSQVVLLDGPAGLSLSGDTLLWTPSASDIGGHTVTLLLLRACDSISQTFELEVVATAKTLEAQN